MINQSTWCQMTINRACLILWLILFAVGMWLAAHKPLWCDELYGQKITIEGSSWGKILTGRFDNEGNNFPLYFAIQKALMSAVKLHFPDDLLKDFQLPVENRKYFLLVYPKGQIILRLLPDALMTTAIVFLVRFFWVREGMMVGLMALLSALSSGMVWGYWAEARPYPLWFLLTLLQALFVIAVLSGEKFSGKIKVRLIIVNWLLAVTAPLGFIQVIFVQEILFLSGQRQLKDYFWAGILPVCAALFFLSGRSHNSLYIAINPVDIISLNCSLEQIALLFFYLMAFSCRQVWVYKSDGYEKRVWKGILHLPHLLMGLCLSIAILVYIAWHWPGEHDGFPVYGRHFFFLSALSVIMAAAMFSDLWSGSRRSPLWRGIFSIFFIVLLFSQWLGGFAHAWYQGYFL